MIFENYIDNLITNLENIEGCLNKKNPKIINICLEGGAFSGSYQYGVLLLIKKLEKKGYIKVNKISGVSIGALMGLVYLTNRLDLVFDYDIKIREYWKNNINYSIVKNKLLNDFIYNDLKNYSDISLCNIINNNLYIKYFNCNTKKYIIKQEYKSKQEIYETILKTTHIPFLANEERTLFYDCIDTSNNDTSNNDMSNIINKEYFLDGGFPYLIQERNNDKNIQTLVLSLSNLYFSKSMLLIDNETNASIRILEGMLYGYKFFKTGNSNMLCSYYDKYSYLNKGIFKLKSFLIYIISLLLSHIFWVLKSYNIDINFIFINTKEYLYKTYPDIKHLLEKTNTNNNYNFLIYKLFIIIKLILKYFIVLIDKQL